LTRAETLMEARLYNQSGEEVGTVQLSDYIYGIEPNVPVMHQAMVRQQANARLGTQNTLGRGEVAGSTRKLYRQKGTGRARQGSIRAPHRKGGGVAHGPHPRSYYKAMPRKMRRLAVRSALSAKLAASELHFISAFEFTQPRTKDMIRCLTALQLEGSTLIVLDQKDDLLQRSVNNLSGVKTLLAPYLNVIDLLQYDNVLIAQPAIDMIETWLGNGGAAAVVGEDDQAIADEADLETPASETEPGEEA